MTNKREEELSLKGAIRRRATRREFSGEPLQGEILTELVWAAFGHTHNDGKLKLRTAPSAGATYPVELYLAIKNVVDYATGIYSYDVSKEKLLLIKRGDFTVQICRASLDQDFILASNAIFLMVYNPSRIVRHYGRESRKFAFLECGHIGQNILLMATALNLASVPVGAFYCRRLNGILNLTGDREVLYMICVGTLKR